MKHIVVILDGAAGWPLEALKGKTTLEAAITPVLDSMGKQGRVGFAQTVPTGAEPSSAAACTSIVGYDPIENYVGRAAIEAASMGIELAPNEIALRINTLTITDDIMTSYACGHITTEESRAIVTRLAAHLNDDTFTFYPGVAYRHILVVKDHPEILALEFTPPHDISDKTTVGQGPRGEGADLLLDLMAKAHELLLTDPTNSAREAAGNLRCTDIWPFWPGSSPAHMVPFSEKFAGKTCALTSGVDLLGGLCVLFKLERLEIDGVTDGPDTDYAAQAQGALEALDTHDVVIIHVESPDEEGHAGDMEGKIGAIESIDRDIMTRVLAYAKNHGDVRVLSMPDHPTPIALKTHVGEPVPFVLWGSGVESNGASGYNEKAAAATGLVLDPGHLVMNELLGMSSSGC